MLALPTELWLRIAHFIPDLDLFRLASVNHLFLNLVTDRRYRHLLIDDDRPSALLHKLAKLEYACLSFPHAQQLTFMKTRSPSGRSCGILDNTSKGNTLSLFALGKGDEGKAAQGDEPSLARCFSVSTLSGALA